MHFTSIGPRAAQVLAAGLLLAAPLAALADVSVSVSVDGSGNITLSPDTVSVGGTHNTKIIWTIATPGWHFTHHGIAIDDNDGEFDELEVDTSGTSCHENDHDDNSKLYKYTVTLSDGTHEISADPAIQNGGHP